jgi:hypothetical protein
MSEASVYQQLRGHLATLRLGAAAEALPGVLDAARAETLGHTAFLERLLAIEVAATTAARRVWSGSRRCRRPGVWPTSTSTPSPRWTGRWSTSWPRCASSRTPPTCCSSGRRGWARRCSRCPSPGPRWKPATGPTTPPPRSLPRAATGAPSRVAGRPRCVSTRGRGCWVIDELGYLPLAAEAAAALFQVITQRYLRGSVILTTNLGIASWGRIFDDPTVAVAMLDRLLHRSVVFNIDGDSYRMRAHRARAESIRKGVITKSGS